MSQLQRLTLHIGSHRAIPRPVNNGRQRPPNLTKLDLRIRLADLCLAALCGLFDGYNNTLHSILDEHASVISKKATIRPVAPRMTDEIKRAKCLRRKAERKWQLSRLPSVTICGGFLNVILNSIVIEPTYWRLHFLHWTRIKEWLSPTRGYVV